MPNLTPVAVVEPSLTLPGDSGPRGMTVWVTYPYAGVDRPKTHGISADTARNADRLVRAINAGAVNYDQTILTDVNGNTYVGDRSRVMGKYLNADLTRLGF